MSALIPEAQSRAVAAILAAARAAGVPVVAVGANARLLAFDRPLNLAPPRSTLDWDFAARCDSWADFDRLRGACLASGFTPGGTEHEVVHAETGTLVDLVPFGGVEQPAGSITWRAGGTVMNVRGMAEALNRSEGREVGPPAGAVPTPPAAILAALKLLAHADRRGRTDRDLLDLWHLVGRYPTAGREAEAFAPPLEGVLAADDFDFSHFGAALLGADLAAAVRPETLADADAALAALSDPESPQLRPLVGRPQDEATESARRAEVAASFDWVRRAARAKADFDARSGSTPTAVRYCS